jgi:hypothetical protein
MPSIRAVGAGLTLLLSPMLWNEKAASVGGCLIEWLRVAVRGTFTPFRLSARLTLFLPAGTDALRKELELIAYSRGSGAILSGCQAMGTYPTKPSG